MTDWEKQFVVNIVERLDQSIARLDPSVQSRLDHMRGQATNSIQSTNATSNLENVGNLVNVRSQERVKSVESLDNAESTRSTESAKRKPVILHTIQHQLESDNEIVPAEIETRLDEIRRQAMAKATRLQQDRAQHKANSWQLSWPALIESLRSAPKSAMASAFVAVVAVSLLLVTVQTDPEITISDEINLLASADDIELYENLDFYLWLAENGISN